MARGPYFYRPGAFSERFFGTDAVANLRREMNRVFDELEIPRRTAGEPAKPTGASAPSSGSAQTGPAPTLSLDVTETETELKVCADLPGVEEADVDVTLDDDLLTIRGERKAEHARQQGRVHISERSAASFQRSIRLPAAVDPDAVRAEFKNGVLTVTLPKPKSAERGRKIPISSGSASAPASDQPASPSKGDAFIQGDGAVGPTPSTGSGADPAKDTENAAKPGGAVHGYNE